MTDRSLASIYLGHAENSQLTGQSKEAAIINNNLNAANRTFLRDISNIRSNDTKPTTSFLSQDTQYLFTNDGNLSIGTTLDGMDLSGVEIPKTTRDPLLASRELLSHKQNIDKEKFYPKVEMQQKRPPQKAPMNLYTMENCDLLELNNPQYVVGYAKEIFEYLASAEEKSNVKYGYLLHSQNEVNDRMRAILIDWLVDIHIKFKLQQETLYLTINILDRFLEKTTIPKSKLQLVGITSMLIAAKYQEIYPPEVKDFVYVADKTYPKEEVLDMEGKILLCLKFNLTVPSALSFLERYSRLAGLEKKYFYFCQYLIELAFLDYKMLRYRPSLIVCGAILLVHRLFKKQGTDEVLLRNTKHNEESMKLCAKDLLLVLKNIEKSTLKAIKRKFLSPQYMEVSKIQVDFP